MPLGNLQKHWKKQMTTRKESKDIKSCGISLHLQKACFTGLDRVYAVNLYWLYSVSRSQAANLYSTFILHRFIGCFFTLYKVGKKYMNKYIESDCTYQGVLRLKAFFASEVYRGGMRVSKKDVSSPDGRNNILSLFRTNACFIGVCESFITRVGFYWSALLHLT